MHNGHPLLFSDAPLQPYLGTRYRTSCSREVFQASLYLIMSFLSEAPDAFDSIQSVRASLLSPSVYLYEPHEQTILYDQSLTHSKIQSGQKNTDRDNSAGILRTYLLSDLNFLCFRCLQEGRSRRFFRTGFPDHERIEHQSEDNENQPCHESSPVRAKCQNNGCRRKQL